MGERRRTPHRNHGAVRRESFGSKKEPLIFVGNQEDVRRRAAFTVLGLYYPDRADAEKGRTLF